MCALSVVRLYDVWCPSIGESCVHKTRDLQSILPPRAASHSADGVQGNVTEYNAMDVMFGNELPHMGLMGHATSPFMDPGLDYTLGYSQVQLVIQASVCAC